MIVFWPLTVMAREELISIILSVFSLKIIFFVSLPSESIKTSPLFSVFNQTVFSDSTYHTSVEVLVNSLLVSVFREIIWSSFFTYSVGIEVLFAHCAVSIFLLKL